MDQQTAVHVLLALSFVLGILAGLGIAWCFRKKEKDEYTQAKEDFLAPERKSGLIDAEDVCNFSSVHFTGPKSPFRLNDTTEFDQAKAFGFLIRHFKTYRERNFVDIYFSCEEPEFAFWYRVFRDEVDVCLPEKMLDALAGFEFQYTENTKPTTFKFTDGTTITVIPKPCLSDWKIVKE
jgi:hypothetical protein